MNFFVNNKGREEHEFVYQIRQEWLYLGANQASRFSLYFLLCDNTIIKNV